METLTRNPFTDERLKELIIVEVVKRGSIEVLGMRTLYDIIESLDPYTNPVTKHEFRAWLLDNGFEEFDSYLLPCAKIYQRWENGEMVEKLVIDYEVGQYDSTEVRTEIEIRARKRNIHPFTLYAEIKLKYGTN